MERSLSWGPPKGLLGSSCGDECHWDGACHGTRLNKLASEYPGEYYLVKNFTWIDLDLKK